MAEWKTVAFIIDGWLMGSVANSDSRHDEIGFAAGDQAANMSNCWASDGFGLKANLACRLRIM
jgi:hypothetical protein